MVAADDALVALVRRVDPDRYFTALFAPAPHRATLLTLYALNHELARACEVTREPGLALIRLQWWREVIEGADRPHEVATPLRAALAAGALSAPYLLAMIEAREWEAEAGAEGFPDEAAWTLWLRGGPGSLMVAAGRALGAPEAALPRLRDLGVGYGVAGQLGNVAVLARQGRCLLPVSTLSEAGLTPHAGIAEPHGPLIQQVRARLADVGRAVLGTPSRCDRTWIAAALPAVLARRDLRRATPPRRPRGAADRFAVLAAALRGRV
jgi:phytoene synthase